MVWVRVGSRYELVRVRVGIRYELAWYDLVRVRVDRHPFVCLANVILSHPQMETVADSEGAHPACPAFRNSNLCTVQKCAIILPY